MALFGKQQEESPTLDDALLDDEAGLDEDPSSLSLLGGVGGGGPDDAELSAMDQQASGGIWANNAMVVVLVIAVGGIGIWGMRFMMRDSETTFVDQEVVTRIENFIALQRNGGPALAAGATAPSTDEDLPDIKETIRLMSEPWREQQIRREELAKNPFVVGVKKVESVEDNSKELERKRAELAGQIERFNLDGVMGGKRPVAVINGELYQEGEILDDFKVTSITESGVYLTHPLMPENIFQLVVEKEEPGKRRR